MNAWSVPYHTLVLARFLVVVLLFGVFWPGLPLLAAKGIRRILHIAHLVGRKSRVLRWHHPWPKRAGE